MYTLKNYSVFKVAQNSKEEFSPAANTCHHCIPQYTHGVQWYTQLPYLFCAARCTTHTTLSLDDWWMKDVSSHVYSIFFLQTFGDGKSTLICRNKQANISGT